MRVLLHVLEPVTAAVIEAAPRLKLIQKIGIGVNTIDLDAARRRGIAVCNMPGTNTQAVAEMTLLLMLATLRRLSQLDRLTRAGEGWSLDPELPDDLGELAGAWSAWSGSAPSRGAWRRCCRRSAPRSSTPAGVRPRMRRIRSCRSHELLPAADVVSLHLPLTKRRGHHRWRGAAAMKRGSVLINTARGPLVDEAALLAGIDERAPSRRRPRRILPRAGRRRRPLAETAERRRDTAPRLADGRDARPQPRG